MASAIFSSSVLTSKFRGCVIGALMGDCLGAPFEGDIRVSKRILNNYLTNLMSGESVQILPYTDDSSMTLSVASSLVEKGELDAKHMAKKFVDEYYSQPKRGYGNNVVDVFRALRETNFEDVFLPAKLQFDGSGSYGNGAAMRIAPIALFGNNRGEQFVMNAANECARITHTHQNGINGAILQCLAVNAALGLDSSQALDPVKFIDNLEEKMENVETKLQANFAIANITEEETKFSHLVATTDMEYLKYVLDIVFTPPMQDPYSVLKTKLVEQFEHSENKNDLKKPYCESLKKIKEIYSQNQEDISSEEIAEYLGNDVSALRSVPTAIYSFLRGMKPFKEYESSNPFLRTLYFAISVGGDTDTIASMAGSIAGAYYGANVIPEVLQKRCELIDEVIKLADKLFEATQKKE